MSPHVVPFADWRQLVPPLTPLATSLEQFGYLIVCITVVVKLTFYSILLTGRRAWKVARAIQTRIMDPRISTPLCVLAYYLLYQVVLLPIAFAAYLFYHHCGIAIQSPWKWFGDAMRSWTINACVLVPTLTFFLYAIRRWPRSWWLIATAVFSLIGAVVVFLDPIVIEPQFHNFTPMNAGPLRKSILDVAQKANVHVNGVFIGAYSSTTTEGNAYVTGLGSSHRIVIWDTLLKQFPPDEIRSIVAHELGHYALHHILIGMLLAILGSIPILYGIKVVIDRGLSRKWLHRGEPPTIAVLGAMVLLLNLLGMPIQNGISRTMEKQADAFSLKTTGDPRGFIHAMQRLCLQNYDDPWRNPIAQFVLGTHPTIAQRIHTAVEFAHQHGMTLENLR